MKPLFVAALLAVALLLPGCAAFSPFGTIPVNPELSAPAQAVQTAINEGNALLIAYNRVVEQDKKDGLITAAERDRRMDRSDALGRELDEAQRLLRAGNTVAAADKAKVTKELILALRREAAERKGV